MRRLEGAFLENGQFAESMIKLLLLAGAPKTSRAECVETLTEAGQ